MDNETAAIKMLEDAARQRGEEGFTPSEKIALAQVYATLAVAETLARIHNRIDGIEDLIAEGH